MHEMGHALGLDDADKNGLAYGTHKVLMGYARTNTEPDLTYHDIQGASVTFLRHTTHQFRKYFFKEGYCYNICFYCDTIDRLYSPYSYATALVDADTCTHDYEKIVSIENTKYWSKCNNCYKVIEHVHEYNNSYEYYSNNRHMAYCSCGEYIYDEHDATLSDRTCSLCDSHVHIYVYSWLSLTQHNALCSCSDVPRREFHVVLESDTNPIKTCLLCGGNASTGIVQEPQSATETLINGSYILPSGIIVLVDEDVEAYLNGTLIFYTYEDLPVID